MEVPYFSNTKQNPNILGFLIDINTRYGLYSVLSRGKKQSSRQKIVIYETIPAAYLFSIIQSAIRKKIDHSFKSHGSRNGFGGRFAISVVDGC
jgi:hypothetical protein